MPTTNPVPSQDPSDLLFNAGKLDEVLNGTSNSFTDRLGVARRTVAGMNADFDAQLADAESDLNVYRADAAASAAESLGYLQTIRATSYGAYASDPATDPLGNPPTVGDEYFNTTANLLKRWNGTNWQASDINTANLAAPSGSSLVGHDGGTVKDVLDAVTGSNGAASVGYTPAGTGAVFTNVQEALRRNDVSIFKFMTPEQIENTKTGGGTIDLTSVVQTAINESSGKRIRLEDGDYTFGIITPVNNTKIFGNGKSTRVKLKSGANSQLFAGSGLSNVSIYNIAFDGNKANQTTAANLFQFLNSSNVNIYSCYIKNSSQDGAYFSGCTDSAAYFNVIEDNARNGVSLGAAAGTSTNVKVLYNKISGHTSPNAIGISFEPAYKCQAVGNILVDNYDAINVAGDAVQAINCNENSICYNKISATVACNRGVIVAGVSATTNENIIVGNSVKGNYARGFVALTTSGNTISENDAIGLTGSSTGFEFTQLTESVISGNKSKNNQLYGFYFDNCSENTVSGNNAKNNSLLNPGVRDGMRFEGGSNNVVTGNHSSGASQNNGIKENGAVVTNTYSGNHVYGNSGAGYSIVPTSGSSIDGRLYATASPVTITGTTAETDLQTTQVPTNVHKSYSGIRIRAAGTKSGAAGNKQLKLYFGASSVIFNQAANNANDWRLEAEIMFLGATTQRITLVGFDGTTITQDYSVTNIDLAASATTVKCTGVLANTADSIVGMLFSVEYIR